MFSTRNHSTALMASKNKESFTLIELLVVLALVAILSVVVVMTLNPAELLKQARDSNRLSDLATINTALNLFSTDVTSGFMGTSTVVYVSVPDTSPTCANLGLPVIPTSTYTYNCVTSANLRNTDGTGWIPVNFQRISSNSPISQLPIDPQNTTSTKYYTYVTGGSWKVIATPESQKYLATAGTDGGSNIGQFEVGNNMSLAPFTDGLVGWWKFEDNNNSATSDSSGFGNTGTWNGTSTSHYESGKVGNYAATFNGSSDYIDAGNAAALNLASKPFSVAFWMKGYGYLLGKGGQSWSSSGWHLVHSYGALLFYVNNGSASNPNTMRATFSTSTWHGIVVVRNGSTANIYVDGQLAKSENNSIHDGSVTSAVSQTIGKTWNTLMAGQLDDVRIYSRALSAAEVQALYNATK